MDGAKVAWRGTLLAVQPRIRLTRSFDQRHHSYLGCVLILRGAEASASPPPWFGAPLTLETFRVRGHRFETFCYGPKSCSAYRAGPTRKAPGRKGMRWEEEDWVDEEATAHRGADE